MSATTTLGVTCTDPIIAATTALTYTEQARAARLELTGAVTYVIDLAMMPAAGCRGVLVQLDLLDAGGTAAAPITVRWTSNAIVKNEEVSAGGAFLIASPAPTKGVTALSIVTTGNAVVHVLAFG